MNLYILLLIVITIYFANEGLNLKYLNNKIRQAKNEIIQTINDLKTTLQNDTKIQK